MKIHSCLIFLALLPICLAGMAAPLPDARQNETLQAICSGTGEAESSSTKLLIWNRDGSVPAIHDQVDPDYRAESADDYGLVLCQEETGHILETCQFSIFFSLPRVRLDYNLQLRAAGNPAKVLYSTRLQGSLPSACDKAGLVTSKQLDIRGTPPAETAMMAVINDILQTTDEDGDGVDRIEEWLAGSDPLDAADPGTLVRISANSRSIPEGDALTILLDFIPGTLAGQAADYRVWAETPGGNFTWIHPAGFMPGDGSLLSARARATRLDRFALTTLPAIGAGTYRLHFDVVVGEREFSDTSSVDVIASDWHFTEISQTAGLDHVHGNFQSTADISLDRQYMAAGVAVADYDRDGWLDLFVTGGSAGSNLLYHNERNGTFRDTKSAAGLATSRLENSGATFADYDGDGWPDLLVSGINTTTRPLLYHNEGDATFREVGTAAGIPFIVNSMGSSFADFDRDGDLDFWMTHWNASNQSKYLFRNDGGTGFTDVSREAGIPDNLMADYTANFADINNDRWPDLLIAADFGTSRIFMNQGNGTFLDTTTASISDENGMGAAVADYDNDGDLDWFVSSIHDSRTQDIGPTRLNWGKSGNRFYVNQGDGTFVDLTGFTGTREGGWGWGACFADFNNDGHLDLFHVNGYASPEGITTAPFEQDLSRLFVSDQQGGFTERAVELGIADRGQGRGIACFDYDRDGDIDIYVANNRQAPLLYENRGLDRHWLEVYVAGENMNSAAIGARVYITIDGITQMRELNAGSNYMSQNPAMAHFGLGSATAVELLRVVWPSGDVRELQDVVADQILTVDK